MTLWFFFASQKFRPQIFGLGEGEKVKEGTSPEKRKYTLVCVIEKHRERDFSEITAQPKKIMVTLLYGKRPFFFNNEKIETSCTEEAAAS